MWKPSKKTLRRLIIFSLFFALIAFALIAFVAESFVEPVLKRRLHTLIIQGSDSLYNYTLGDLDASLLGGSVEVENLHIEVDQKRYEQLAALHALPALTVKLDMTKGHIKGVGMIALLLGKKVNIREIMTKDADIKILRHVKEDRIAATGTPLWKAIQPAIKSVSIGTINLDGVKLLFRNADTAESVKLQFDTCYAVFKNILIDSLASADTSRIGFTKEVSLKFRDLKFRSPDSTYKLKAEQINYSSKSRTFEVIDFKMQPTLEEKEAFYKSVGVRESMDVYKFQRILLTNFQLERYLHRNKIIADSLLIDDPEIDIYLDKTYPEVFESKIGKFPHQKLQNALVNINIKGVAVKNASVTYVEKDDKSLQEGKLTLSDVDVRIGNLTNDSLSISKNNKAVADLDGKILGNSPISLRMTFFLDSTGGQFLAEGKIENVNANQLNALAVPFANTELQSFNLRQLSFNISGDDFGAKGSVGLLYDKLFVVLRKRNEENGVNKKNGFLTKIVNKYVLYDSNPGSDGVVRTTNSAIVARLNKQSFFALLWKAIFSGMQNVMMKSGSIQ